MPSSATVIIAPAHRVQGRLQVPGDKSISHRYALLAALTGVLQALLMQSMTGGIGSLGQPAFTCGTYIVVLIQVFVMGMGFLALQKAAVDATAGRPIDMKQSWRFAVQPPVLGTLLLQVLAFIGAALAYTEQTGSQARP